MAPDGTIPWKRELEITADHNALGRDHPDRNIEFGLTVRA